MHEPDDFELGVALGLGDVLGELPDLNQLPLDVLVLTGCAGHGP